GVRAYYDAALARAHTGEAAARAVLADQLRRSQLIAAVRAPPPAREAVAAFAATYAAAPARLVLLDRPAWWVGGGDRGLAIRSIAPDALFRAPAGRWSRVVGSDGAHGVRPLGPPLPLAAAAPAAAASSIAAALRRFAQAAFYEAWLVGRER